MVGQIAEDLIREGTSSQVSSLLATESPLIQLDKLKFMQYNFNSVGIVKI